MNVEVPEVFSAEVAKITAAKFICEKHHLWSVVVERMDGDTVKITERCERTVRNRTDAPQPRRCWYTIEEYGFKHGPAAITECMIDANGQRYGFFEVHDHGRWIEAFTNQITVAPNDTAAVSCSSVQYGRINGDAWETFTDPIVDPVIEVKIDDAIFDHVAEFSASGEIAHERNGDVHRYRLSGVFFPGQFMRVRWWPKK